MKVLVLISALLLAGNSLAEPAPASVEVPGTLGAGPVPLMQPPPAVNSMADARKAGMQPLILPPTVPFTSCETSAAYRELGMQRWLTLILGLIVGAGGGYLFAVRRNKPALPAAEAD